MQMRDFCATSVRAQTSLNERDHLAACVADIAERGLALQIEYPVLDKFAQLSGLLSFGRSREKTKHESGKADAAGEYGGKTASTAEAVIV